MTADAFFFSAYLIFLTCCNVCAGFKFFYRPENMGKEEFSKTFPCRSKLIGLFLFQTLGVVYLWSQDSNSLLLVNSLLLLGVSSTLGYTAEIYYFNARNSALDSLLYYFPGVIPLIPIAVQAYTGAKLLPVWASVIIVGSVACWYFVKQCRSCYKVVQLIKNVRQGMYSEVSDFPVKDTFMIQWMPLILNMSAFLVLLADSAWVNLIRDVILSPAIVGFTIFSLSARRKVNSNDIIRKGENISLAVSKSTMTDKKYRELSATLKKVMEEDRLYLQQHLDMQTLQKAMGTNRNYIFEVISRSGQGSFYEMINRYRVEHSKMLMDKSPEMLLSDVAESSGFCSPSAFSKAFRAYTGMTPSRYLRQLQEK